MTKFFLKSVRIVHRTASIDLLLLKVKKNIYQIGFTKLISGSLST